MKFNIKWFSITALIISFIAASLFFTWTAVNGFGADVVKLFESVHPNGGMSIIENMDKGFTSRILGIVVNTLYAVVDCFIISFAFSSLYNFFISKFDKS